jgi:hypothetical protein
MVSSGHVLGGGGTINFLAWFRGVPLDYDSWAKRGMTGWGWANVLPLLRRVEDHKLGASTLFGTGGPMPVTTAPDLNPISLAFITAGVAEGLDLNRDFNGARRDGVGLLYSNVRNGERSAPRAAISTPGCAGPASPSSPGATAPRRVVIHNHAVTGVEYTGCRGPTEHRAVAFGRPVCRNAARSAPTHAVRHRPAMAPSPIVTPGMMTASRPIHTSLPMTVLPRLRIVGSSSAVRSSQVPLAQWKNADLLPLDNTARADIFRRVAGGGGEVIAGKVRELRRNRDRECPDDARPVSPGSG